MPKTKHRVAPFKNIIAVICYYAEMNGISREETFKAALITRGTMYQRIKEPDSFRLSELSRLAKVLNISLLKLLTGDVEEQNEITERTILK